MEQKTNWHVRKHFDDEVLQKLGKALTDPDVRALVESAYNDSTHAIERAEKEMQDVYEDIPRLLERASKATGVAPSRLIVITRRIAASLRDLEWYHVLNLVTSFHSIKENIEAEEAKQSQVKENKSQ